MNEKSGEKYILNVKINKEFNIVFVVVVVVVVVVAGGTTVIENGTKPMKARKTSIHQNELLKLSFWRSKKFKLIYISIESGLCRCKLWK